jgi:hypothetical protein
VPRWLVVASVDPSGGGRLEGEQIEGFMDRVTDVVGDALSQVRAPGLLPDPQRWGIGGYKTGY